MKSKLILTAFLISIFVTTFAGGGKIIFSKKPITATSPENFPVETFDVGDKIYVRIFIDKPLSTIKLIDGALKSKNPSNELHIYGSIDKKDESYYLNSEKVNDEIKDGQTFDCFIGADDKGKSTQEFIAFKTSLFNLPNGTRTIKIKIWARNGNYCSKNPIAEGEYTINKTANSKLSIGRSFKDVVPKMNNSTIEEKAVKTINEFNKTAYWKNNATVISKAKIVSEDWNPVRHPSTGVILARALAISVLEKNDKGSCQVVTYQLIQEYNGSGYNESLKIQYKSNGTEAVVLETKSADCD